MLVLVVLASRSLQLELPLERDLDPVAGDGGVPPSSVGAVQSRLIVVVPLAVAERPVGAPGTVVAASPWRRAGLAVLEAVPVPTELIAETR